MTKPHETPSFSEFITDLDNGTIEQTLTEELAAVVRATEETGKQGEMTMRILVRKEGKMAVVGIEVKTKLPKHPLHGTLFYVGENGELLREDPRQLALKGLDKPTKLRTVSFPTAPTADEQTVEADDSEEN